MRKESSAQPPPLLSSCTPLEALKSEYKFIFKEALKMRTESLLGSSVIAHELSFYLYPNF